MARYIVIEGVEGLGKSTQVDKLVEFLSNSGYSVLKTKEPGTPLAPVTMSLRALMLDSQYDAALTPTARELLSQAIRSVHMEKVVIPAKAKYDFIVQDRGVMSGLAYGAACGNDLKWLTEMACRVCGLPLHDAKQLYNIYDDVIILSGNVETGLARARGAKAEFQAGDAIEAKGVRFMERVEGHFRELSPLFLHRFVNVDGKSIDEVHRDILRALRIA